jgi:hypothetical protein
MRYVPLTLIAALVAMWGCFNGSPVGPGQKLPDLSVTPMENAEAELAALWLSGEIVAPVTMYTQIDHDLEVIRNQWLDSIPEVKIQFYPYWVPSRLSLGFDPLTYELVETGQYHAWDSLNEFYRVDTMSFLSDYNYVALTFKGRLNPMVLVDQYAGLPGLEYAHTDSPIGDWPVLLIYKAPSQLKYFFRNAWGDCPSGCIWSHYFYLVVEGDSAIFRGSYLPRHQDEDYPPWFDTAMTARQNYFQFKIWKADTAR